MELRPVIRSNILCRLAFGQIVICLLLSQLPQSQGQIDQAPEKPDIAKRQASLSQDPLLSKPVFLRDTAQARIGETVVDIKELSEPLFVQDIVGEWLWLGKAWVQRSQVMTHQEAWIVYNEQVSKAPASATAWMKRAKCLIAKGELSNAASDLDKAIGLAPEQSEAYFFRGICKAASGQHANAIEDFDNAIDRDSRFADAYSSRAHSKMSLGNLAGSLSDYSKAIQINPSHQQAHFGRGNLKMSVGNPKGAIQDFDRAIEINPANSRIYFNRGNAKIALNKLKEAIKDFDAAIQIDPKEVNAFINRGNIKSQLGDLQGALRDFDNAITFNAKDVDAFYNRGRVNRMLGQYHQAIQDLEIAIGFDPKDSDTYSQRGEAKYYSGDYDGALEDLKIAIRLNPSAKHASNIHFLAEFKANKMQSELSSTQLAILLNYQGIDHLRRCEYYAATQDFDDAIGLNPELLSNYTEQSFLLSTVKYENLRNPQRAMELADKSLSIDPSSAYAKNAKACALAAKQDFDAAIDWQQQALLDVDFAMDREPFGGVFAKGRISKWRDRQMWLLP